MTARRFSFRGQFYRVAARDLAVMGADGRGWYADAGASIRRYADGLGVPSRYVCDVTAILSPRVSVSFNVTLAKRYLETGSADGCMGSRAKALETYERTGTFNGPKVNAFADALAGDPGAVVVDVWMFRAMGDQRSPTAKHYRDVAERVHRVADSLGWGGAETQAAIWTGVRRVVGFAAHSDGRLAFD